MKWRIYVGDAKDASTYQFLSQVPLPEYNFLLHPIFKLNNKYKYFYPALF